MKKNCELCKLPAATFCDSDQASLCWTCDSKIHSANFLVARHVRTLLCHRCKSPTPWKASGSSLSNALSLCETCGCGGRGRKLEGEEGEESEGDNEDDDEVDTDFDEEEEEEEEVDGDEDGDNQVVPWSSTAAPPPASSSSGSGESVSKCNDNDEEVVSKLVTTTSIVSLKRRREEDRDLQASDSKICVNQQRYGGARRRDDGEPSSKASIRQVSDGNGPENSQPQD